MAQLSGFKQDAEGRVRFKIQGAHPSYPNGLRRVLVAEIPLLAIDIYCPEENTTEMTDEMIGHRLGLVPFQSSGCDGQFLYRANCSCDPGPCDQCSIRYLFDVTHEGSELERGRATQQDLVRIPHEVITRTIPEAFGPLQEIGPVLLAKFVKGDRIKFEAFATKGVGSEHAKWQSCTNPCFNYVPQVTYNAQAGSVLSKQDLVKLADSCPMGLLSYSEDMEDLVVSPRAKKDCTLCGDCQRMARDELNCPGALSVITEPGFFRFQFETNGTYPAKELLLLASDILIRKATLARERYGEALCRFLARKLSDL